MFRGGIKAHLRIRGQVRVLVRDQDDNALGAVAPGEATVVFVFARSSHAAISVERHSNGLETGFLTAAGAAYGVQGTFSSVCIRLFTGGC